MIIMVWLGLSFAVAILAASYERNPFAWLLVSLFLSPLIGGALLLVSGHAADNIPRRDGSVEQVDTSMGWGLAVPVFVILFGIVAIYWLVNF